MTKIKIDFFWNGIPMLGKKFLDSSHDFLIGSIDLMILGGTTTEIINPFIVLFDHENTVIIMVICQAVLCKNIKTNFKVYCVEVIIQFFSRIISRFFKRNSGWTSGQGIGLLHFIWNTLLMRNQFAWSDSLHTGIE